MSHQFKYDSSTLICKFDYPETRRREEESIKASTGSCKSSQKKLEVDHLANEKASRTGEGGENSQRRKKKIAARFQKEKYSKQY